MLVSRPSPQQSLERLLEGNQRFRNGETTAVTFGARQSTAPQRPFAIVVGCSDSRMPVEVLFDQGVGALFVVRVAGNIITPAILGSVEFAATDCGAPLVLVLGHTRCGAIAATIGAGPEADISDNLRDITDRIEPNIRPVVEGRSVDDALKREAMRANVRASAAQIGQRSSVLSQLISDGTLRVVAAEYELETGSVHVLDA